MQRFVRFSVFMHPKTCEIKMLPHRLQHTDTDKYTSCYIRIHCMAVMEGTYIVNIINFVTKQSSELIKTRAEQHKTRFWLAGFISRTYYYLAMAGNNEWWVCCFCYSCSRPTAICWYCWLVFILLVAVRYIYYRAYIWFETWLARPVIGWFSLSTWPTWPISVSFFVKKNVYWSKCDASYSRLKW